MWYCPKLVKGQYHDPEPYDPVPLNRKVIN